MMDLSVIIVNYNVKYFAAQCLDSVRKASGNLQVEVWVVDNHSSDGSVNFLKSLFPAVNFMENLSNRGFGAANNQAAHFCEGRYILLLNPDTILSEDSLRKCVEFLDLHPEAGAAGVRMIDSQGRFLRESKRSFPSPGAALSKILGLTSLFPRSKWWSRYYLGHLNAKENHSVEVLAGAFMMVRRKVWEEVGGFDEDFFMYGEDIDLSYRIARSGYLNFYFASTTILHYKGESTRKGSLNYVKMFYQAMSIFSRKHLRKGQATFLDSLIQLAIWLRAGLSVLIRILLFAGLKMMDFVLLTAGFLIVRKFWMDQIKPMNTYPLGVVFPGFIVASLVIMVSLYFSGAYDLGARKWNLGKGVLTGTLVNLIIYSLLPEGLRFSRAMILFGGLIGLVGIWLVRWLLTFFQVRDSEGVRDSRKNFLLVGTLEEGHEVRKILTESGIRDRLVGIVFPGYETPPAEGFLGNLLQLESLVSIFRIGEMIFSTQSCSYQFLLETMQQFGPRLQYPTFLRESGVIIRSQGSELSPEALAPSRFRICSPSGRRGKRTADVCLALFFILTFPVYLFCAGQVTSFLKTCRKVLTGEKTWVGFILPDPSRKWLPPLKPGVLNPSGKGLPQDMDSGQLHRVNEWYATQYSPWSDVRLVLRMYRELGKA
ncbi:MAG: glycosyltransferase family 2 protein [Chitinophagaceae bacterium]